MSLPYRKLTEQKLHVAVYLIVVGFCFLFAAVTKAPSWRDNNAYATTLYLSLLHTTAVWLTTKLLIFYVHKRFTGFRSVRRRLQVFAAAALPYALLLGAFRIFFAEQTNFSDEPEASWRFYLYTSGITLLLFLFQVAVHEGLCCFSEWQRTMQEAGNGERVDAQALKRLPEVSLAPHFLLSTLHTLTGLIEVNKESAALFAQNLTDVHRYLLNADGKIAISLEKELTFAVAYFTLLKTRYAGGLELVVECCGAEDFRLPPLSLRVLIDGALHDNGTTRSQALCIFIYLDKRNQKLIVQTNRPFGVVGEKNDVAIRHLRRRFALLNLPEPTACFTEDDWSVSLPLLKNPVHQRVNS